jgi:ribosomal-protein-alanine N-acetyltransferase
MARITVRRARLEELDAVLDLWEEMMQYHARLDPRFQPAADGQALFRPTLRSWMAESDVRVLVAVTEGRVIGYASGRIVESAPVLDPPYFGHVSEICVAPEWRRFGVGRRLFRALYAWFRRRGLTTLQLNVAARNPVSQAFWHEMGFGDYMDRMWMDL